MFEMTSIGLKKLYETEVDKPWNPDDGVMWLMKHYEDLNLYEKVPVLSKNVHITLSDKANWLSQQHCSVCHPTFPIKIIPVRIRPESWQAIDSLDKAAFKLAMKHRLSATHYAIQEGRICLTFLFVCSVKRKVKDLDNMAKLLMDSIKGIVMADDSNVDHLNIMRLTHEGEEEYVTFKISASHINDHSNVVHPQLRHSWAGADALCIEDFRQPTYIGIFRNNSA
jgi:Holliday junction resolvase RusA-like endonuclease